MNIGKRTDTANLADDVTGDAFGVEYLEGYSVAATWTDSTPGNDTFVSGVLDVKTLTFPDHATAVDGDYIVISDQAGGKWAAGLSKNTLEVQTLTYPALAGAVDGDFIIVEDAAGIQYALAFDTTGGAAVTPAGPLWTAADEKALVNISGTTDAASVAAACETAWNLLSGFTAAITSDDSAADGTMTFTQVVAGPVVDPSPHNAAEDGAGTILGVETIEGHATTLPTGAAWLAVAAANKSFVDIDGATTAASVAALVETAIDALTGFTAVITSDDTAADGTMLITQVVRGPVTNPDPHNADDSGVGTITGVLTTAGITSDVDLDNDTLNLGAHEMYTGLKVRFTTTDTLPTGISLATDYYVIVISDDLIQIASSLANAEAGTELDISGYGVGTHTAVVQDALAGVLKLQACNNPFTDNVNMYPDPDAVWVDIPGSSIAVAGAGSQFWNVSDVFYAAFRVVWTRTTGIGSYTAYLLAKGVQ